MLRMLGPHGFWCISTALGPKKILKKHGIFGRCILPLPLLVHVNYPPYKATQVVVNMEHSDVKCKMITHSGNHQYNHSQSL